MKKSVNCKNCDNPFGEIENKLLNLNFKRVSNIQYDFNTQKASVKCRSCSQYSTISFDDKLVNDIDYKKTAGKLLG